MTRTGLTSWAQQQLQSVQHLVNKMKNAITSPQRVAVGVGALGARWYHLKHIVVRNPSPLAGGVNAAMGMSVSLGATALMSGTVVC